MPQSAWTGSIVFGLVSVPVQLYRATEASSGPDLHQVHAADGGRIRLKRYCEIEGREVPLYEIGRGIEVGRDEVVLTASDMDTLPIPSKNMIDVRGFVDEAVFDPIRYDRGYYVGLAQRSPGKPYVLLREAMRERGQVAVAKVTLASRESLAVLRVLGDLLVLHTMLWPDEVREPRGLAAPSDHVHPNELAMMRSLMAAMSEGFEPGQLHDGYRRALEDLIDAKLHGEQPAEFKAPAAHVVDIGAVLAQSLAAAQARTRTEPADGGETAKAAGKPKPPSDRGGSRRRTG